MRRLQTIAYVVLLGACLVACSVSSHLIAKHAPIQSEVQKAALKSSFWGEMCHNEDDGESVDSCQQVITSKHGSISVPWLAQKVVRDEQGRRVPAGWTIGRKPIPVAQIAYFYYIFMGLWFLFTGIPGRSTRKWHILPLILAVLGVAASLNYISIMWFSLEQWCPLCMSLHGVDFVLLGCAVVLWPWKSLYGPQEATASTSGVTDQPFDEPAAGGSAMNLRLAAATLALVVAVCSASLLQRDLQTRVAVEVIRHERSKKQFEAYREDERIVLNAFRGTAVRDIPVREDAAALGSAEAAHTLVVFSDLQCPNCRQFELKFRKNILPMWAGKLRVIFRHYPLCTDCNQHHRASLQSPRGLHPQACLAAAATEAARLQGGSDAFWKMEEAILVNQERLPQLEFEGLVELGGQVGLDTSRLKSDMTGETVRSVIERDIDDASALGVTGTPSVFLDGRYVHPLQRGSTVFWERVVEELTGQPAAKPRTERGPHSSDSSAGSASPETGP